MKRFLSFITIAMKVLVLLVLILVTIPLCGSFIGEVIDYRRDIVEQRKYDKCLLDSSMVRTSVLVAEEKFYLYNEVKKEREEQQKLVEQKEKREQRIIENMQGNWSLSLVNSEDEGNEYKVRIKDDNLTFLTAPSNFDKYARNYKIALYDTYNCDPRFGIIYFDEEGVGHEIGILERFQSDNEWLLKVREFPRRASDNDESEIESEDEPEDDHSNDGNEHEEQDESEDSFWKTYAKLTKQL